MSPLGRTLSPASAGHVVEPRANRTSGPRQSFTRSGSPHIHTVNGSGQSPHQTTSIPAPHARHRTPPISYFLLPGKISLHVPILFDNLTWTFSADARSLAESFLLLGSLFYANRKLASVFRPSHTPNPSVSTGKTFTLLTGLYALSFAEINLLIATCIVYVIWSHSSFVKKASTPSPSDADEVRAPSPRIESRESRRGGSVRPFQNRIHFGFVWMSVPKNFRCAHSPGI